MGKRVNEPWRQLGLLGAARCRHGSEGVNDFFQVRVKLLWDKIKVSVDWGKGVAAMLEHGSGQISSDFLGLCAKTPEHSVGFPATNELDGLVVFVGTQEGSGAARAQAVGSDLVGRDAGDGGGVDSSLFEPVGEIRSGDVFVGVIGGIVDPVEWRFRRGPVLP